MPSRSAGVRTSFGVGAEPAQDGGVRLEAALEGEYADYQPR